MMFVQSNNEKVCSYCGSNKRIRKINGNYYCGKHANQIERRGKILKRTRFDPNEIVIYESYAEIVLYTRDGQERDRTKIDLNDVAKCKLHKWHKKESARGKEYCFTRINGVAIRLHRYVLDYFCTELEVDHINGDGLDNRKENLRIVSHQDNMMNQRKLPSNNTTGHIGVYWHSQNNNWCARIKTNGKCIHLGSFENIEDAIAARKKGELLYFGKAKAVNYETI